MRFAVIPTIAAAGRPGRLTGDFDEARVSLAKAIELEPEMSSFARICAYPGGGNAQYWTLYEKVGAVSLRRAGIPDQ
ncbi:MAG TPA: hypothetical protein VFE60_01975 [Roseiarcus sp.]|nr:hypothetical protein [Roseiarcus sp.]